MAGGISFLTGAVVGANEIAEDNLKQKNKLKEIQWNLSRQAAFDTIKRFQDTYASEEAKARQAEQNMRALAAKGLHPVAINKAFEMGMDLSKPETEEYIRGMKISPRAQQTAQPNQPVNDANPMGMPTTNSPAMQGTPKPQQPPMGTGATGGGSGAFPAPGQPQQAAPMPQQAGAPQPQQPGAAGAAPRVDQLQANSTAPTQMQANGAMPTQDGGIVRGKPKNLPNQQPLRNAYETLGFKGQDLDKQMAPYTSMSNSRAMPLPTGPEELDITLPPPKNLIDASTKAEALVMQNLTRINSAEEATKVWRAFMKSFQVSDADINRVQPAFSQAPEGFWKNPELKAKIEEENRKRLAVAAAQQYMKEGRPDKAQEVLAPYFPLSDTMTMDTGGKQGDLPVLTRRESTGSKAPLDPNPGFNQIRAGIAMYYPGDVMFNPTTNSIELKKFDSPLRDEINSVHTLATQIYRDSLKEEGGKLVGKTPAEALEEAYEKVTTPKATQTALDKFLKIRNEIGKKNNVNPDPAADDATALSRLTDRERKLVIRHLMNSNRTP